ncbi:MAG: hypothetical protein NT158_06025 [Cyanobacteria bacterium]|nr:hypothetical protein [Cyanobacteriota bacterium]
MPTFATTLAAVDATTVAAMAAPGTQMMVLFLVNLICAGLAFAVAESKGHRTWIWLLTAFLLGPLGLLAAVGLSDRKTHRLLASIARASDQIEGELERF